jgi:ABC-2 type transport system ATP-binding protein
MFGYMYLVSNLNKSYGTKVVLNNINAHFPTGKVIGLLGPNGAGKTTLIRILNLITKQDSGEVSFDQKKLGTSNLQSIGYMPEEKGLYPNMTVTDQLKFFGKLREMQTSLINEKIKYWLDRFQMQQYAKMKLSALSKGNQQKIQFIITVMHEPKVLILDEPLSGLDPVNAEVINQVIEEFTKMGKTIIFSTHRMEQVDDICDYVILLNHGCKILEGNLAQIKKDHIEKQIRIQLLEISDAEKLIDYLKTQAIKATQKGDKIIVDIPEGKDFNSLAQIIFAINIPLLTIQQVLPTMNQIFFKYV